MTRRIPWRAAVAGALLVALPTMLVACGGDDDDDDTPTVAATTAAASPSADATTTSTSTTEATATATTGGGSTATTTATPDDGTPSTGGGNTAPVDVPADPGNATGIVTLTDVRIGEHETADRIVFEFDGTNLPAARIEYVDSVQNCGSGSNVTVEGEKLLLVTLQQTQAHNDAGQATAPNVVPGPGQTIEGSLRTCDFEGVVSYVIGITGEGPFKVSTLDGPTRLVIDVLK